MKGNGVTYEILPGFNRPCKLREHQPSLRLRCFLTVRCVTIHLFAEILAIGGGRGVKDYLQFRIGSFHHPTWSDILFTSRLVIEEGPRP